MDLTELPTSKSGNRYCLVLQDFYTKFVNAYPLMRQDASTVAHTIFKEYIREHGVPRSLHSDQGRQFEAATMRALYDALGIDKSRTTPYHPQGDGLVERFNRTLKDMLSKYVSTTGDDWDDHLPHVLLAYNTAVHASTGYTPFFLTHGREANLPADVILGPTPQASPTTPSTMSYARKLTTSLRTAFKEVRQNTRLAGQKQKLAYDAKVSHRAYQEGDRVWLHDPTTVRQKLKPRWKGPYTVVKRLEPGVTYKLRDDNGKHQVVHFNRLKKCHSNTSVAPPGRRAHPPELQSQGATPTQAPATTRPELQSQGATSTLTSVTTRRGRQIRLPSRYLD